MENKNKKPHTAKKTLPPKLATKKTLPPKPATKKVAPPPPPHILKEEPEIKEQKTTQTVEAPKAEVKKEKEKEKKEFSMKSKLPFWAYCVFVPLIFCMILAIILFAIGAASYSGQI